MKWEKEELNRAIDLLKSGNSFDIIARQLSRTTKAVKVKLNKLGFKSSEFIVDNFNEAKTCLNCENTFESLISEGRKFCCSSCSATYNNKKRGVENSCLNCGGEINKGYKFCCHKCNKEFNRKKLFADIENGENASDRSFKKYLIHHYGEKCMECGWDKRNMYSGNVPIELEHMDGNSENNSLDNLKLLCPNCHSLTPTYKALNTGMGRHKRRERYKQGKSF